MILIMCILVCKGKIYMSILMTSNQHDKMNNVDYILGCKNDVAFKRNYPGLYPDKLQLTTCQAFELHD